MSPLALWPQRVRYAYDRLNSIYVNNDIDACEATFVPSLPASPEGRERPEMGRLGQAVEGRFHSRIFAIGNHINQRLLRPVHDWLLQILGRLPTDGTFH